MTRRKARRGCRLLRSTTVCSASPARALLAVSADFAMGARGGDGEVVPRPLTVDGAMDFVHRLIHGPEHRKQPVDKSRRLKLLASYLPGPSTLTRVCTAPRTLTRAMDTAGEDAELTCTHSTHRLDVRRPRRETVTTHHLLTLTPPSPLISRSLTIILVAIIGYFTDYAGYKREVRRKRTRIRTIS